MKRLSIITASLLVLLCAATAFAVQGRLPKDGGGVTMQNAIALAPVPAASLCATLTATKGTITTVLMDGYTQLDWQAVDAAGAPLVVRRYLNSNTAYMPRSSGQIINDKPITGGWAIQNAVFKKLSTATATTATVCSDRQ